MAGHVAEEAPPQSDLTHLQVRPACVGDIPQILALVAPGIQAGRVLPRTRRQVATAVRDILLLCRGGVPVAVGQASLIEETLGEVHVLEGGTKRDRAVLLRHLSAGLEALGAEQLIAMSDDPAWFLDRGFSRTSIARHKAKWEGHCLRCPRHPLCCLEAVEKPLR